jgi:hypothetical protein
MCEPVTSYIAANAIPLAIGAAGAGATVYGSQKQQEGAMQNAAAQWQHNMDFQNKVTQQQNDAMARSLAAGQQQWNAEQGRQRSMDAERQALLGDVIDGSTGEDLYRRKMAEARADREQGYADNRAERGEYGAVPVSGGSTANRVVKQSVQRDRTARDADMSKRLSAQAGLSSLGDAVQGLDLWRQPYADRIQASQTAARNSAGIANSERNAAMNLAGVPDRVLVKGMTPFRGGSKMGLGDALVGFGNAAMGYAGGQMVPGASTQNTNLVNGANPAANVNDAWLHNAMSNPYLY